MPSLFLDLVEHPELAPQYAADTITRIVGQSGAVNSVSADVARESRGMFHGIAISPSLIFTCITVPLSPDLPPGFYALDRFSGRYVNGSLPAPSVGVALPFTCRLISASVSGNIESGQVLFFDAGAFPVPGVHAVPVITVYSYAYNRLTGSFSASIVRQSSLPAAAPNAPAGFSIGFCADPEVLPDGSVAFADQIYGAVYRWLPDGSLTMALGPRSANQSDAIPQLVSGLWASIQKATTVFNGFPPVDFEFAGNYAPGCNYLSSDFQNLYFENENTGSMYKIPIASLSDARNPWDRCADIQAIWTDPTISDPNARITYFAGHVRDPLNNLLYITRFNNNEIVSIDITQPATQPLVSVARDVDLYKGPVSIAVAPKTIGQTPLYVVSDMEYMLFGLNPYIPPPPPGQFQLPWFVTALLRP